MYNMIDKIKRKGKLPLNNRSEWGLLFRYSNTTVTCVNSKKCWDTLIEQSYIVACSQHTIHKQTGFFMINDNLLCHWELHSPELLHPSIPLFTLSTFAWQPQTLVYLVVIPALYTKHQEHLYKVNKKLIFALSLISYCKNFTGL